MAISYCFKVYDILLARLGIDHPYTQAVYNNSKYLFGLNNPEGNFEQWIAEHASSDLHNIANQFMLYKQRKPWKNMQLS